MHAEFYFKTTLGVSRVEGGRFVVISIIRRSPSPRKF